MQNAVVAKWLNRRFRGDGVLVHQFDYMDGLHPASHWWDAPPRPHKSPHLSATLVRAEMRRTLRQAQIPVYSDVQGGVVLRADAPVACAYPRDTGTERRGCLGPRCVPGCVPDSKTRLQDRAVLWCNTSYVWPCALRPEMLQMALEAQSTRFERAVRFPAARRRYLWWPHAEPNEVVVDRRAYPEFIEAVFFLASNTTARGECPRSHRRLSQKWMGPRCERFASAAHRSLARAWSLQPPPALLEFDLGNWTAPFSSSAAAV